MHMVRNSLRFVSWKDRKLIAADLKLIYQSITVDKAEIELEAFARTWDNQYPSISQSWRNHWPNLIAFFDYPNEIRKLIYTLIPSGAFMTFRLQVPLNPLIA
jgi:transposase-like protein